jgi:hypothetical protein
VPPGEARERPAAEKLPPLDDMVAKVPAGLRGLLDDLFRAKFTAVRRFAPADPSAEAPVRPSNSGPRA